MSATLQIDGLVKEYVAGRRVLDGLSLSIGSTGLTAVIGPSGTGKSTLLRCINRLVELKKQRERRERLHNIAAE